MKNKVALEVANRLINDYFEFTSKRYRKLGERKFDSIYGVWDRQSFYNLRNLFFNLVTGEGSFDNFYNRFDAPRTAKGDKPIAWGPIFLPDMIDSIVWDIKLKFEDKVKEINKLYKKCIKLEKDFKKKRKTKKQVVK